MLVTEVRRAQVCSGVSIEAPARATVKRCCFHRPGDRAVEQGIDMQLGGRTRASAGTTQISGTRVVELTFAW